MPLALVSKGKKLVRYHLACGTTDKSRWLHISWEEASVKRCTKSRSAPSISANHGNGRSASGQFKRESTRRRLTNAGVIKIIPKRRVFARLYVEVCACNLLLLGMPCSATDGGAYSEFTATLFLQLSESAMEKATSCHNRSLAVEEMGTCV